MNTAQEIYDLAHQRLEEAKILFENNMCDGAFYLAGYSIELMLKWKITQLFGLDSLYSNDQTKVPNIDGVNKLREVTKTHDLYTLLLFSGLRVKFDNEKASNLQLSKAGSLFMSTWKESVRYQPSFYTHFKLL
ncbi:MAG: hypothetical protein RLZZ546_1096 [Bacteroidota bacterium]